MSVLCTRVDATFRFRTEINGVAKMKT